MSPLLVVILVNVALAGAAIALYVMGQLQAPEVMASEIVWPWIAMTAFGLIVWQIFWSIGKLKHPRK